MLKNKIAVITGASRGIGLATAKIFAMHGAQVVMLGRSIEALEAAKKHVLSMVDEAALDLIVCDVAKPDDVKNAFQQVFKRYKRLDTLVANAGVLDDALVGMITNDQINNTFAINTYGIIYCCQYASRLMARSGGGSIINLTSIIGVNGNLGQVVYGGSKAAVIGITKSLSKELAANQIRVNAIAPGFIDTDMARSISEDKYKERLMSIKMGKAGQPEDVANTALFLASDLSSYITGQVIGVDGGMLI